MKVLRYLVAVWLFSGGVTTHAWAGLVFGSRSAGFIVEDNATVNFNTASLSDGYVCSTGGTVESNSGAYTNMLVETFSDTTTSSVLFDGSGSFGSSISLGNNQRLEVAGGNIEETVTATGALATPSVVAGYGSFEESLHIALNKTLALEWDNPLNVSIVSDNTGTTAILRKDLAFAPNKFFTGAAMTIDGTNARLLFGGTSVIAPTMITNNQTWKNANVSLTGPIFLNSVAINFDSFYGAINGNNHQITLYDTDSLLNCGTGGGKLVDLTLVNTHYRALTGSSLWTLENVTFVSSNNQSLTMTGYLGSGEIDIFGADGGEVVFYDTTRVDLNTRVELDGYWIIDSNTYINGKHNVLELGDAVLELNADLFLSDIVLSEVSNYSIYNNDSFSLYLSDVVWINTDGTSARIDSLPYSTNGARCKISAYESGDIFRNDETYWYDAHVELLTDVNLESSWIAGNECVLVIEGNGHAMHLNEGSLGAEEYDGYLGRLVLRNLVLTGVTQNSFADYFGVIELSNVTIKLAENVDLSEYNSWFEITGPVTFITSGYSFSTWNNGSEGGSFVDGVTVSYDMLGESDAPVVNGFYLNNDARLLFVSELVSGDLSITTGGFHALAATHHLSNTTSGVIGSTITFDANDVISYDGQGRSLVFPATSDEVFSVAAGTTLVTSNIVLDGLLPEHISVSPGAYMLFGDGTTIRLSSDWELNQPFTIGSSPSATNETIIIDCNGFTINMQDSNALFRLRGGAGQVLRFCNGRITKLSGDKVCAWDHDSQIIFENMELVINDTSDYVLGNGVNVAVRFEGNCVITGRRGNSFINQSHNTFTIASGAKLTIKDGITYSHNNDGPENFVMSDASATLELIDATFTSDNTDEEALLLSDGTIVIDHASTFNVGDYGITLDESLNIQIRPSATIAVDGSGTLLYFVAP